MYSLEISPELDALLIVFTAIIPSLSVSFCFHCWTATSLRISHSVVMALRSSLKQCGLKIATKTIEGFVREIDRVAPWYNLPHKSSTLLRGTYCLCLVYLTCIRDYFQCTYKCSCIRSQFPLTVRSILVS